MANKRKGQTVSHSQWWAHLRPCGRQEFWGKQRAADKAICETGDDYACEPLVKKKHRKPFGIEQRSRWNEHWGSSRGYIGSLGEWMPYKWYETAEKRDKAMVSLQAMNQAARIRIQEFRPVDR